MTRDLLEKPFEGDCGLACMCGGNASVLGDLAYLKGDSSIVQATARIRSDRSQPTMQTPDSGRLLNWLQLLPILRLVQTSAMSRH